MYESRLLAPIFSAVSQDLARAVKVVGICTHLKNVELVSVMVGGILACFCKVGLCCLYAVCVCELRPHHGPSQRHT